MNLFRKMSSAWIGYSDTQSEGSWKWQNPNEDGMDDNYRKWTPGRPDNYGGNEDCGAVTDQSQWEDLNCETKLPFFCEFGKVLRNS